MDSGIIFPAEVFLVLERQLEHFGKILILAKLTSFQHG